MSEDEKLKKILRENRIEAPAPNFSERIILRARPDGTVRPLERFNGTFWKIGKGFFDIVASPQSVLAMCVSCVLIGLLMGAEYKKREIASLEFEQEIEWAMLTDLEDEFL